MGLVSPRSFARFGFIAGLSLFVYVCPAQNASLRGYVRGPEGAPLSAAEVKLTCSSDSSRSLHTMSEANGEFRFAALRPCVYSLSAERSGYGSAAAPEVTVSAAPATLTQDLTLRPAPPPGAGAASRPKFESSGVRGLIDPGGYSAPANAAAAAGLLSGMADVERGKSADPVSSNAAEFACAHGPELIHAADEHPGNAEANRIAGSFYMAHGSPGRAIPYLKLAQKAGGQGGATTYDLAAALEAAGDFAQARQSLLALPSAQRDARYFLLQARAEEGLQHFADAVEQYRTLLAMQPDEENTFALGYELILAGSVVDAGEVFRAGIAQYPRSVTLRVGAGTAEFLQGRGAIALRSFLEAADLDPADSRPYPFLAHAFAVSGEQADRVLDVMKRHVALDTKDGSAYADYASVLLHRKPAPVGSEMPAPPEDSEAEALLNRALALDPKLLDAHSNLATVYLHREDFASAARELELVVALAPGSKEAHYRLATAYRRTGRAALADEQLRVFRETRDTEAKNGGVSLLPFLSVVQQPGQHEGLTACPSDTAK